MSTTISAPASISAAFVPTGAGQSGNANMNANRSDINLLIRITKSNSSPFSIVLLIYRMFCNHLVPNPSIRRSNNAIHRQANDTVLHERAFIFAHASNAVCN